MDRPMTDNVLRHENAVHAETGGTSAHTAAFGFLPAFFDFATSTVYRSRFADGKLAPFHLLDGLPEHLVASRDELGRVLRAKASLVSGFERGGFFYSRNAAARAVADWMPARPH